MTRLWLYFQVRDIVVLYFHRLQLNVQDEFIDDGSTRKLGMLLLIQIVGL